VNGDQLGPSSSGKAKFVKKGLFLFALLLDNNNLSRFGAFYFAKKNQLYKF